MADPEKPKQFRFTLPDGSKTDWVSGSSEADAWSNYQNRGQAKPVAAAAPKEGAPGEPPSAGAFDWPSDFARGATRGLAGDVVGLGQIGGDVLEAAGAGDTAKAIGASRGARWLSKYANAPSSNFAEKAGRFVGAGLPFGFRNPFVTGAVASGVQPTESGDLQSHAINAAAGGVTGGLLGRITRAGSAEPANVSAQWWNRALDLIGTPRNARPNTLSPETNAQVQTLIGDRLNDLRSQMNVDFGTIAPVLMRGINTITGRLDPAYQRNWQELAQVYVLDPISGGAPITGRALADYVSRLGGEAERLFQLSLSRMPDAPQYRMQADALRAIVNGLETVGSRGRADLLQGIQNAKQAYFQWSIGDAAMSAGRDSAASARQLLEQWQKRLGGNRGGAARLGRVTGQEAQNRDWLREMNRMEPSERSRWMWQGLRAIPAAAAWWLSRDLPLPWEARYGAAATAATAIDPSKAARYLGRIPGADRLVAGMTGVGTAEASNDLQGQMAGPMQ